MSEAEDPESKTQEATEKKIQDALEEGRLPVSRDLVNAFGLFSLLACLGFVFGGATGRLTSSLAILFSNVGMLGFETGADIGRYVESVGIEAGRFLAPIVLIFMVAGLAGSFVQGAPRFVASRIAPDIARLSLVAGWRRLFGLDGAIELLKASAKLFIVGGAIVFAGISAS